MNRAFTPQEEDQYNHGFLNVYIWFLENKDKLPPIELKAQLDQKIEQELGALFRKFEPQKKQDDSKPPMTLGMKQ